MKGAFLQALLAAAAADEDLWLVNADPLFPAVDRFRERYPERFVAVGTDGPASVGLAVGLALSRKNVFLAASGAGGALDALGYIRATVCGHRANVKLIAIGVGLDNGMHGPGLHVADDLARFRLLPDMAVVAPADALEMELLTHAAAVRPGPLYMRVGRSPVPPVHRQLSSLEIGQAIVVRPGTDLTLIASGSALGAAVRVAHVLARIGFDPRVVSMPTVAPLDRGVIERAVRETRAIATVEEHVVSGGLGGAVAEAAASVPGASVPLLRLGLSPFVEEVGSPAYLLGRAGLTESGLLDALKPLLREVERRAPEREKPADVAWDSGPALS